MYAEESRAPSVAHQRDDVDGTYPLESGPAIEVIELANGETVWFVPDYVSQDTFDIHAHTMRIGRSSTVSGATTTSPSTEIGQVSLPSIHFGTDQTTGFSCISRNTSDRGQKEA